MTEGQLNANVEQYLQAAAANVPPPPITSDPLVSGATPIEQLLRVLGLAANLGDPTDQAISDEEHAKRDAQTTLAAEEFANQDEEAAAELKGVAAQDPSAQMAQQLPQMAAGIAGALSGALGGALQPLSQIPQQVAQGAQQALQTGMGLFQQAGGSTAAGLDDAALADAPLLDDFGTATSDVGDFGGASGGSGLGEDVGAGGSGGGTLGGGMGGTAPMAMLGPPAVPSASTSPSSAPAMPAPPSTPAPAANAGTGGMAGMPMVPPAAVNGAAAGENNGKADTKRVAAPAVRNGAPVQGRLTVPPSVPVVTTKVEGKPVATKRILLSPNNDGNQPPEGNT